MLLDYSPGYIYDAERICPMEKALIDISLNLMANNLSGMLGLDVPKKHCSVILAKGEVIAVGFNRYKTSKIAYEFGYIHGEYHSELDALIQVHGELENYRKEDLALINFRLNRFKNVKISRPCAKCMRWAVDMFGTFVYTDVEGGITIENVDSGSTNQVVSNDSLVCLLKLKKEIARV